MAKKPENLPKKTKVQPLTSSSEQRDEFSPKTKDLLAKNVAFLCSFPDCGQPTVGANKDPAKTPVNLGVAAHIHAAAKGGPRYLECQSPEQRKHASNGIWLCYNHSVLIDKDPERYPAEDIRQWKVAAELRSAHDLARKKQDPPGSKPKPNLLPEHGPLPPGSRMVHQVNPDFVGRQQDLLDLYRALNLHSKAVITPKAAATGLGGIGKTQLAIEYAYRYGRFYPGGVFWLDFANPDQVPNEIAACGLTMGLFGPDNAGSLANQVHLVRQAWERDEQARLLIFDNCEHESQIVTWSPKSTQNRVLITSRCQKWTHAIQIQELRLAVLARQESIHLLQTLAPKLSVEQAEAVAAKLGDLPLALYIAGCYLETYGDPETYLSELKTSPLAILQFKETGYQPTAHDLHVGKTFGLSYNRLDPEDPIDEAASDLLIRAANFAPGETIRQQDLLATLADTDKKTAIDGLIRLKQLGLIRPDQDELSLHRLLVAYCQATYLAETKEQAQAAVIETIRSLAVKANVNGHPAQMSPILVHLRFLAETHFGQTSTQSANLCNEIGCYLGNVAAYPEAEKFYRQAVRHGEQVHGANHQDTATFLSNLAELLRATNRLTEAEPLCRRALAIDETTFGPDHPKVAIRLNNLAGLLEATSRLTEAESLFRRALAINETTFGPDHPSIAIRLNNLANVLEATNRLTEAEPLYRRALAIGEATLGPDHPKVANRLKNLAGLLRATSRLTEAEPLYRRALALFQASYGLDHPQTQLVAKNLRILLDEMGKDS